VAVVTVTSRLADRYLVTVAGGGQPGGNAAKWWCRGVLIAALAVLAASAVVSGLTGHQPGALPGLTGFLGTLLIVQAALLAALAVTVVVLAQGCLTGNAPSG
jgi:hypothetical protein